MLEYQPFYQPKLRIAVLSPGLSTGGAEIWQATLVRHAQTVCYKCLIALDWTPTHVLPLFGGVPIHVATGGALEVANKALEIIPSVGGVDLVMYWGLDPMPNLENLHVPVVHVSHSSGMEISRRESHEEFVIRHGKSRANFLASVSESASLLFNHALREKETITVIHNGADIERTRPAFGGAEQRRKWKIPKEAKLALFMGRFSEEKGPDLLLKAMTLLPDDWHVAFMGWGPMEDELKKRARHMLPKGSIDSVSRVIFPQPRISGLGDIYAACDCVVLPSFSEAFPLVMVEAWHAGVPLVCAEFNTLKEIETTYAEGQTMAWHVGCPPTPRELASVIQETDPNDERVERACQISWNNFSAAAMTARWESYFYNCIAEWFTIGQLGMLQISPPQELLDDTDGLHYPV